MKKYYISYGSNLNIKQMKKRCKSANIIGISKINDYELLYKGEENKAYLTIEKQKGKSVPVGIWEIDENDELNLDDYEDYPNLYYKKNIKLDVKLKENEQIKEIEAFIYIMYEQKKKALPLDKYVKICKQGYKDFGFDLYILDEAMITTKNKL